MSVRSWFNLVLVMASIFFGSVASAQTRPLIFLPFQEGREVFCSQGNNDTPTHSGSMAYAYDFTGGDEYSIAGVSLYAPFSGTVREVVRSTTSTSGWGNTIVIQADSSAGGYFVRMARLAVNTIPSTLTLGTYVTQGQFIGKVGSTGNSTGAHLHIQMMTSVSGSSIPFDFVEGPVDYQDWLVSDLRANRYVIDNLGRTSYGAPFNNVTNSSSGTFSSYSWTDGAHGSNYRGTTSTGARFNWLFRLNTSYASRLYKVTFWAHCPYSSTRDTATAYTVARSSTVVIRTPLNQRDFRSYNNFQFMIGYISSVASGTSFTVSAYRGNNRMCADSIVVDLSW